MKFTDVSFIGASGRVLKVMGPSCGDGGMIQMLLEYGRQEGRVFDVTGFDIDPINVLVCQEAGLNVVQADFLIVKPEPTMDLIIANPPFNKNELIKHIEHAQKFLNESGVMVVVVSTAWIKGNTANPMRGWLLDQAQIGGDSLLQSGDYFPAGTFDSVSIETTFITLYSTVKAQRIANAKWYREKNISEFDMWFCSDAASRAWVERIDAKQEPEQIL